MTDFKNRPTVNGADVAVANLSTVFTAQQIIANNVSLAMRDSGANNRRIFLLSGGNNIYYGNIDNDMNAGLFLLAGGTEHIKFFTNGVERGRFESGGNLKVLYGLEVDGLGNFSVAGLRTKHESGAVPSGGSTGEVRVGTDRIWVQDAGTWKSAAVSAAGAPSFASTAKWGTD